MYNDNKNNPKITPGENQVAQQIRFRKQTQITLKDQVESSNSRHASAIEEMLSITPESSVEQNENDGAKSPVGYGTHYTYEGEDRDGKFEDEAGSYTFKDGSRFVGKMVNGAFDGPGKHYFKSGMFRGVWTKGRVVSGDYVYNDDLVYVEDKDWEYCNGKSDRRFVAEHIHGIDPAGASRITGHEMDYLMPEGCYDAGDGYIDLKNPGGEGEEGGVRDFKTKEFVRHPDFVEREFIRTKARVEASLIE